MDSTLSSPLPHGNLNILKYTQFLIPYRFTVFTYTDKQQGLRKHTFFSCLTPLPRKIKRELNPDKAPLNSSRCSFSMMVKWANVGLVQAYDGEMLINDGKMLINWLWNVCMIIYSFHHHWLSISPSLAWSKPSIGHLTIIEKLHRLKRGYSIVTHSE